MVFFFLHSRLLVASLELLQFEIEIVPNGDRCISSISGNNDMILYAP